MRQFLLACASVAALACAAPQAMAQGEGWSLEKAAEPYKGSEISVIFLDRPGYRAIIDLLPQFEEATGIKVNYEIVPYENTRERQVLNFTSMGDLTIALVDLVWIGEFAENGWIVPVEDFTSDPEITDPKLNLQGFFPLLLDAFGTWDGTVYGLPFDNYSGLLFYNRCMLEEAGFDGPPDSWAQLKDEYGPKLTNDGKFAFALQSRRGETQSADSFMRVLWPFGGSLLNDEFRSNLMSEGSQAGLNFRQELMQYMPQGIVSYDHNEAVNALAQGQVAIDHRVVVLLLHACRPRHVDARRLPCRRAGAGRSGRPPAGAGRLLACRRLAGAGRAPEGILAVHPVGDIGRHRPGLRGCRRRLRPHGGL